MDLEYTGKERKTRA